MSLIERAAERMLSQQQADAARTTPEEDDPIESEFAPAPVAVPPADFEQEYYEIDHDHLATRGFINPAGDESRTARSFRRIKRPLLLAHQGHVLAGDVAQRTNIIAVTSTLPGEGKTYMSINLALSLASEVDREVLLINADVLQRGMERELQMSLRRGLVDIVRGDYTLEEGIMRTNVRSLSILPAGTNTGNLDETFASRAAENLFDCLSQEDPERLIILDCPPILATSEAIVLAGLGGQVVLVVEARRTPRELLQQSVNQLKRYSSVSMVLNKTTDRLRLMAMGSDYYEEYGYGYGYGYGYAQKE